MINTHEYRKTNGTDPESKREGPAVFQADQMPEQHKLQGQRRRFNNDESVDASKRYNDT